MDRAKEIFMKYGGSHFHIHRDMMWDEYKSYEVSKATEDEWFKECQENCIAQIKEGDDVSFNMSKVCTIIREKKNTEYLSELVQALEVSINEIDTFRRLVVTEQLAELIRFLELNDIAYPSECIDFIKLSLEEITSEPMRLSESTMKMSLLKIKHIDNMEEYIIQRAENNLGEFR